jgi:hypothetical protein
MRYRSITATLTALAACLALLLTPTAANAAEEIPPVLYGESGTTTETESAGPIYAGYRWPSSATAAGICVENKMSGLTQGGSTYDSGVLWSVLEWRANGAPTAYYRDDNGCDLLPWSQKVIVQPIWDYTKNWCGKADPVTYDGAPRLIYRMTIYINLTSEASFKGCGASTSNRARKYHVITHEMGHGLGTLADLDSSDDPGWGNSIMDYSTDYRTQPTALDKYRMEWLWRNGGNW